MIRWLSYAIGMLSVILSTKIYSHAPLNSDELHLTRQFRYLLNDRLVNCFNYFVGNWLKYYCSDVIHNNRYYSSQSLCNKHETQGHWIFFLWNSFDRWRRKKHAFSDIEAFIDLRKDIYINNPIIAYYNINSLRFMI